MEPTHSCRQGISVGSLVSPRRRGAARLSKGPTTSRLAARPSTEHPDGDALRNPAPHPPPACECVASLPSAGTYEASENVLIGNTCMYGATGGALFVNGRAGERFAVRNSMADAVVEVMSHAAARRYRGKRPGQGEEGRVTPAPRGGRMAHGVVIPHGIRGPLPLTRPWLPPRVRSVFGWPCWIRTEAAGYEPSLGGR